jgi:hypothetical protein
MEKEQPRFGVFLMQLTVEFITCILCTVSNSSIPIAISNLEKKQLNVPQKYIKLPDLKLAKPGSTMFKLGYYNQPSIYGSFGPVWEKPSLKLRPWFDCAVEKLQAQFSENKEFADLCKVEQVSCTFCLQTNGEITSVKIWNSSNPNLMDAKAIKFLMSASLLPKPPNELLERERLLVTFDRKGVTLDTDVKTYSNGPDAAFEILEAGRDHAISDSIFDFGK